MRVAGSEIWTTLSTDPSTTSPLPKSTVKVSSPAWSVTWISLPATEANGIVTLEVPLPVAPAIKVWIRLPCVCQSC